MPPRPPAPPTAAGIARLLVRRPVAASGLRRELAVLRTTPDRLGAGAVTIAALWPAGTRGHLEATAVRPATIDPDLAAGVVGTDPPAVRPCREVLVEAHRKLLGKGRDRPLSADPRLCADAVRSTEHLHGVSIGPGHGIPPQRRPRVFGGPLTATAAPLAAPVFDPRPGWSIQRARVLAALTVVEHRNTGRHGIARIRVGHTIAGRRRAPRPWSSWRSGSAGRIRQQLHRDRRSQSGTSRTHPLRRSAGPDRRTAGQPGRRPESRRLESHSPPARRSVPRSQTRGRTRDS